MSLAALRVVTPERSPGYFAAQSVGSRAKTLTPEALNGTALAAAVGEGPHRSGLLVPVPRSSKLTRVKSSRTAEGKRDARTGRSMTPLSPGPPGLNRSTPSPGASVAGCSITESAMVGPLRWA